MKFFRPVTELGLAVSFLMYGLKVDATLCNADKYV